MLLERGKNDGTVALLTAIVAAGGRRPAPGDRGARPRARDVGRRRRRDPRCGGWPRRARRSARSRSTPRAIERLLVQTDADAAHVRRGARQAPRVGGQGRPDPRRGRRGERRGRILGGRLRVLRRDRPARRGGRARAARAALRRAGRAAGDRAVEKIEDIWPIQLLGMVAGEVRRMLLMRARLDEAGPGGFDAAMSLPDVPGAGPAAAARAGGALRPFAVRRRRRGRPHTFALYKAAQRASQFSSRELARALARAADVDVRLKTSAPVARDDLGLRGGADRRSGFEARPKTRGTAPLLRSPPCLWWKVSLSNLVYGAKWPRVSPSISRPARP